MSTYATDHASALADVQAAGAAADFVLTTPGTQDPTTETWSGPTTSTVFGFAVGDRGSLTLYAALGLIVSATKTLFWVPVTLGELPALSSTVVWNGVPYTVKNIAPIEPNGVSIAASIVVSV